MDPLWNKWTLKIVNFMDLAPLNCMGKIQDGRYLENEKYFGDGTNSETSGHGPLSNGIIKMEIQMQD